MPLPFFKMLHLLKSERTVWNYKPNESFRETRFFSNTFLDVYDNEASFRVKGRSTWEAICFVDQVNTESWYLRGKLHKAVKCVFVAFFLCTYMTCDRKSIDRSTCMYSDDLSSRPCL